MYNRQPETFWRYVTERAINITTQKINSSTRIQITFSTPNFSNPIAVVTYTLSPSNHTQLKICQLPSTVSNLNASGEPVTVTHSVYYRINLNRANDGRCYFSITPLSSQIEINDDNGVMENRYSIMK